MTSEIGSTHVRRAVRCVLAGLCVLAIAASGRAAEEAGAPRQPTAHAMVNSIPWANLPMPRTLYPIAELQERWGRATTDPKLQRRADEARRKAEKYVRIPIARWTELIPARAPQPTGPNNECPFTGTPYTWGVFDENSLDLETNPFRLKSKWSHDWLCERPEDWPANYPLKVAGTRDIAYWDGRTEKLDFVYGAGKTKGTKWYPANLVWACRLRQIAERALPALREAYLATGDAKYAAPIVAILNRFANVFPAFPQYGNRTRKEFLADSRRKSYLDKQIWKYPFRLLEGYGVSAIGDGGPAREMAQAYLAIEHSPAWGAAGEAEALKARIKKNVFEEFALEFTAVDVKCGNHVAGVVSALLALGIALQDEFLVGRYNQVMTEWLYDHNGYDGISNEGSVTYASMLGGMNQRWWDEFCKLYPDAPALHPFCKDVGKTQALMETLLGRESSHGDGLDAVFGPRWDMRTGLDKDGRETRQPSRSFPGFGLTILRAGGEGRRLEVILSHDRVVGHEHDDMLGVQVFYRGVPILNHLGYCVPERSLDLDVQRNPLAKDILKIEFPKKLRVYAETPHEIKKKYGDDFHVAKSPLTKNTVCVDEHSSWKYAGWGADHGSPFGNLEFIRLNETADGAGAGFEVVEASGTNLLRGAHGKVDDFRRALIAVTRPDGRPYVVDVFWCTGGSRHMLLWHSHGEEVASTFPRNGTPYGSLTKWLDSWVPERKDKEGASWYKPAYGEKAIRNLLAIPGSSLPEVWNHTWRLDWMAWCAGKPGTPEWAADRIRPVFLRLHGLKPETSESELVGIRAISDYYAAFANRVVAGTKLSGTVSFEDGLTYVGQLHRGKSGLSSTFVHVLEPVSDGERPSIRAIRKLDPEPGAAPRAAGTAALSVEFEDGSRDLVIALPEQGSLGFRNGLKMAGRYGLVRLDSRGNPVEARLAGGTHLSFGGRALIEKAPAMFEGELVRLEGDIAGDRSRSLFLVKPASDWGPELALAGRYILVKYLSGRTEGYVVDRIEKTEDGLLRVVLKGHPPFVDLWGEVYEVTKNNVFTGPNKNPNAATPYLAGSRVVFPTLDLDLPLEKLSWHNWGISRHHVAGDVDLAKLGVGNGMPYAIMPDTRGARVAIAADWSMAGEAGRRE